MQPTMTPTAARASRPPVTPTIHLQSSESAHTLANRCKMKNRVYSVLLTTQGVVATFTLLVQVVVIIKMLAPGNVIIVTVLVEGVVIITLLIYGVVTMAVLVQGIVSSQSWYR